MNDQELNEAVARKLGYWKDDILNSYTKGPNTVGPTPNFCEDISAAWEIVTSFLATRSSLRSFRLDINNTSRWYAQFRDAEYERLSYDAIAETAPLAICKAFLKLP